MKKAGCFSVLCASFLAAATVFQPVKTVAENNYKKHDITPFNFSSKELEKISIDDTGISVDVPYSWDYDKEYDCYYPGSEDESVAFYYFDSSDEKKFTPKQDIDDVVEYFLKTEPELFENTISKTTTEYYDVGGHYIAKTSYDVTTTDDGKKVSWKEINYIIPVNKQNILNINIVLEAGKKQNYTKLEEALILTIKDQNILLFNDYINSSATQAQAAAIGAVTRNAGNTAAVSEPVVAPETKAIVHTYVLNTNTMKFHLPNCSSVGQMKASNRWDVEMSRDDVIAMGYVPCKRCHP